MELKFLNFRKTGPVKELKSYDSMDKISAMLFFHIMKTGELELLRVKKEEEQKTWENLCESYYISMNKPEYDKILNKLKRKEIIRNKLTTCYACALLMSIGSESPDIEKTLTYFGYKQGGGLDQLNSMLAREGSYLRLLDSQAILEAEKNGKQEEINFWRMVSDYENVAGRQFNMDKITLARWVEMTKSIKSYVRNK